MKKFLLKTWSFLKKELMLAASVLAAALALIITPPDKSLLSGIDWRTLGTLLMMLLVLEGFKKENIFLPLMKIAGKCGNIRNLSIFLIFSVFFSSMFVTNDVSLIIFVPLTILLFRAEEKEKYILPVISMENIAAIRGSLLTPFGSPQNLYLYGQSGISAGSFILRMLPLCVFSAGLLLLFIFALYKNHGRDKLSAKEGAIETAWAPERKKNRILYLGLFLLIVFVIVTRTAFWYIALIIVLITVFIADRSLYKKTDYVLLLTFLCFFVFSSSITENEAISAFLMKNVTGHEYISSILLSQVISNVPASIVLWPFTENLTALLYGLDSAGLVSVIGSLASVINYRIYVREYPGKGLKFIGVFTLVSIIFFALVVVPQYYLSMVNF